MNRRLQIGRRIRSIRSKLGFTQIELADKLKVAAKTISAYEVGDSYPSLDVLITICKLGGVSVGWLIMGDTIKDEGQEITDQEILLLQQFREADQSGREAIIKVAELATRKARKEE